MTFENDEKRREHFREKLREKLKDLEFRKIEDFIKQYGMPYDPNVPYSREPFAADVKKLFEEYIDELTKGKEPGKVRIVLE